MIEKVYKKKGYLWNAKGLKLYVRNPLFILYLFAIDLHFKIFKQRLI